MSLNVFDKLPLLNFINFLNIFLATFLLYRMSSGFLKTWMLNTTRILARATQFCVNMSYYCMQSIQQPLQINKNLIAGVILGPDILFLVYRISKNFQMILEYLVAIG